MNQAGRRNERIWRTESACRQRDRVLVYSDSELYLWDPDEYNAKVFCYVNSK